MKKKKLTLIILGIIMFFVSFIIAFGATYLFEFVRGNQGRELVVVVFSILLSFAAFASAISFIVNGVDNSINEQNY